MFIDNQYKLDAFDIEHSPDLVFFNCELNALVIVELKRCAFISLYLGLPCTYLRLTIMCKPHENPAIGIVLCNSASGRMPLLPLVSELRTHKSNL